MKKFLRSAGVLSLSFYLFSSLSAGDDLIQDVEPTTTSPAVMGGHLAALSQVEMVKVETASGSEGRTQLVATVVYSSICQPAASFIVLKNPEPGSYSVIEARAAIPKGRVTCQARNRVELKIPVAEFAGEQPKLEILRVNGKQLGTNLE